jgi:hypothetical protein
VGACNLFAIQSFTTASLDAIKRKSGCFSDPPVPPDEQSLKSSNVAVSDGDREHINVAPHRVQQL